MSPRQDQPRQDQPRNIKGTDRWRAYARAVNVHLYPLFMSKIVD